ncbi:hypothetical protein PHYBOEH_005596 [Phytophthora boehmeriae]|uniref:BAR domain-containing protein n=1 Tax=Phytophthora boehmeriae TaxID=109152 RepID=A0A8T1WLS4_9STRA|nr:hypothetical protein PHYBOEH_005596 [Phytophthora boehmeriae]
MTRYSRLDELEHGTMKDALSSLTAQYLNTSVQHQHLAKSLEEDVLKPIETLFAQNSARAQNFTRHLNNAKKEAKAQEDAYRREYAIFDKNFRDASAAFSAAMDSGVSSTLLEDQYHWRLSQMEPSESTANTNASPSGLMVKKTISSSSHKLVNWLQHHRKDDLASNTVKLMEAAELSRRKCQLSWQDVEMNRIDMYREVQTVLVGYQQIAETRIATIATNLRKHVVFASSALANEQYDWQAVAPKFENVDTISDLRDFIARCQRACGSEDRPTLAHIKVNDLCSATANSAMLSPSSKPCRPLRKTCLEIRDVSSKKVPFDYDGNQDLLSEVLGTRRSTSVDGIKYAQEERLEDPVQLPPACDAEAGMDCNDPPVTEDSSASAQNINLETRTPPDGQDEGSGSPDGTQVINAKAQNCEPEYDSDESSRSVSPVGSSNSLSTHHVNEIEVEVAPSPIAKPI